MKLKAARREDAGVPGSGSMANNPKVAAANAERGLTRDRERATAAHLKAPESLNEKFFTVGEVAETFNVCPRTVSRWIKRKKLVAHDFEGMIRISERDLGDFIARRRRI
jgi:excisionase family DNA binding protein